MTIVTISSGVHSSGLYVPSTEAVLVEPGGSVSAFDIHGTLTISSGATGVGDIVDSGGTLGGAPGVEGVLGVASDTIVHDGGAQGVSDGGSAVSTKVRDGGVETVGTGGLGLSDQIFAGGILVVHASASNSVLYSGTMAVESGGEAVRTIVDGGVISAIGGVTTGTIMHSGVISVADSGLLEGAIVRRGDIFVQSGGVSSDTRLSSDANADAFRNGTVEDTFVSSGATVFAGVSGTVVGATISSGGELVMALSNSVASDIALRVGAMVQVYVASATALISGGDLDFFNSNGAVELGSASLTGGGEGLSVVSVSTSDGQTTFLIEDPKPTGVVAGASLLAQALAGVQTERSIPGSSTSAPQSSSLAEPLVKPR